MLVLETSEKGVLWYIAGLRNTAVSAGDKQLWEGPGVANPVLTLAIRVCQKHFPRPGCSSTFLKAETVVESLRLKKDH